MTVCINCGADTGIALLGANEGIYRCPDCGTKTIGGPKCAKCGTRGNRVGTVGEHEKLPGGLCPECEAKQREADEVVRQGGVYWKCPLGHSGAVRGESGLAKAVRKEMGVPIGPCGVEFTEKDCPACMLNRGEDPYAPAEV